MHVQRLSSAPCDRAAPPRSEADQRARSRGSSTRAASASGLRSGRTRSMSTPSGPVVEQPTNTAPAVCERLMPSHGAPSTKGRPAAFRPMPIRSGPTRSIRATASLSRTCAVAYEVCAAAGIREWRARSRTGSIRTRAACS
ncbi:hypothetical protein OG311_38325 (plasmid) [Streptomyces sp. NBC_01343]|nr:hypothetical protein OG311_38325 [Streptomyces sp. NBC_01343]